jgi:tetratricopeptide (TPR) repeat protein
MRSCIFLFYICVSTTIGAQGSDGTGRPFEDPDGLYANRDDLGKAKHAAEIWADRYARSPQEGFEAAWKLARANYWLGTHGSDAERRRLLDQGIDAARKAVVLQPQRPEGHFWLAANMGALAESAGLTAGLKYRKPIKEELQTVLRIDAAFEQGSADRALGRWYFKVPGLFGGSLRLAEQHLRESLKYNQHSTASHFFLADVLLKAGREDEARAELSAVLDAPFDPGWEPENREFKEKARRLLGTLTPRR